MRFLEIAQRIRQECGIAGSGPTSLSGQTGELKRVVDWMYAAYQDIQASHSTWEFLRDEFSFSTAIGQADYPALIDLNEWDTDTLRCYLNLDDEQFLPHVDWEVFRDTYKMGSNRSRAGRPTCFSIKPNNAISFDCVPDGIYTITGEYYSYPKNIASQNDSPVFPEQYHMAIVYRAMMFFGTYAAEPDKYSVGQDEYQRMLRRMASTLLPRITFSEPLA